MKNMMSLVKNSNRLLIAVLTVLTVFFAGCKDKNDPEQPQPEQQTQPQQTETLAGNVARPSWSVPSDYDVTSSMTVVVKVANLNGSIDNSPIVNDDDLLAAFFGETCLGVASPQNGLFFLYIAAPVTGNPSSVTLRYYCAHYKNIFEAKDAFLFSNDTNLGTVAEPFIPAFVVAK